MTPFSRPLDVDRMPASGVETAIAATAAECAAVADEIGLPAVGALTASFKVVRAAGGRVNVDGEVSATITQVCVVSLDPFDSELRQPIDLTFASVDKPMLQERHRRRVSDQGGVSDKGRPGRDAPHAPAQKPAIVQVEGEEDPPDPIVDGRIDLGAVAVEFLTLALDLYPRKPGVAFDDVVLGEDDAPPPSAFAALERLKDRS